MQQRETANSVNQASALQEILMMPAVQGIKHRFTNIQEAGCGSGCTGTCAGKCAGVDSSVFDEEFN